MKNLLKMDREMMKHYNKNFQVSKRKSQAQKDVNELYFETQMSISKKGGFGNKNSNSGFSKKAANFQTGN